MLVAQNIERDIAAWKKQEEEIRRIFSPSVVNGRAFQQEKLRQLDRVYYKHTLLKTAGGRQHDVLLKMLKMERDNLERRLYPNLLLRLLRRLIQPLKAIAVAKIVKTQRMESDQSLKDNLVKAGFGGINWRQVEQQVQQGEPSFSVSHTSEMSTGKQADYELSFVKDEEGRYQASLKVDAHPEQNKKQVFAVDAARPTTAA